MDIKQHILELKNFNWKDEIFDFQPKDIKIEENNEITKQSIITRGFTQAIYVWQDPQDSKYKIMDGHTRRSLLLELEEDGYTIPEKLPCIILENDTITTNTQAFEKYWLSFNTKTNPINKVKLNEFAVELNAEVVDMQELNVQMNEISISDALQDTYNNIKPYSNKEIDVDEMETECKMTFKFEAMMYESVLRRFNEIKEEKEFATNELVLLELLKQYGA